VTAAERSADSRILCRAGGDELRRELKPGAALDGSAGNVQDAIDNDRLAVQPGPQMAIRRHPRHDCEPGNGRAVQLHARGVTPDVTAATHSVPKKKAPAGTGAQEYPNPSVSPNGHDGGSPSSAT
jgi:hypothetical protein